VTPLTFNVVAADNVAKTHCATSPMF